MRIRRIIFIVCISNTIVINFGTNPVRGGSPAKDNRIIINAM